MKMKITLAIAGLMIAGLAFFTSCGGGGNTDVKQNDETVVTDQPAQPAATEPTADQMALGKKIFETPGKCITCHGAEGKGTDKVFPSLVGSEFLLTNKVQAVNQVLNGSLKVVANKTVKYPTPMPFQVETKEEAVAVINYVLNSFGNKGGVVTLDEVKDLKIER
jgi:mono/diheme cytochrome c family protein